LNPEILREETDFPRSVELKRDSERQCRREFSVTTEGGAVPLGVFSREGHQETVG
jgi:hypothetical protein